MRLKLGFLLCGCLLVCFSACASNNTQRQQTGSVSTVTNAQASQPVNAQPITENANEAGAVPSSAPSKDVETATSGVDPCSLITGKEVAKIQGGAVKETKSSQQGGGDFLMSQCFYTAEDFERSVSLAVVQPNPSHPDKQPRQYFTEKFRAAGNKSDAERQKEREREKAKEQKSEAKNQAEGARGAEEEEEEASAERVSGLGDEAYWVKTGPSASLYVLKKNQFLILSIGGGDAEPVKLKKTKALAQHALKRLK